MRRIVAVILDGILLFIVSAVVLTLLQYWIGLNTWEVESSDCWSATTTFGGTFISALLSLAYKVWMESNHRADPGQAGARHSRGEGGVRSDDHDGRCPHSRSFLGGPLHAFRLWLCLRIAGIHWIRLARRRSDISDCIACPATTWRQVCEHGRGPRRSDTGRAFGIRPTGSHDEFAKDGNATSTSNPQYRRRHLDRMQFLR